MGRRLGLKSLFSKAKDPTPTTTTRLSPSSPSSPLSPPSPSSWPWPSCKHPRTHSFRAAAAGDEVYKTVINSAYLDSPESLFSNSSLDQSESLSTASEEEGGDPVEAVIRGLRSDRLFFGSGNATSSIMEEAKAPFKESVAMSVESEDPYRDFRESMEEMVAAHGLKEWEGLQELLVWYLRVNGKKTHGFIVGAFVDLVVGFAGPSASSLTSDDVFEIEESRDEGSASGSC